MLKKVTYILSTFVIIIALYGLTIGTISKSLSIMLFFLSLLSLVRGIESFQKNNQLSGWINILAFLFLLFVTFQTSLVH